ncbi:hypothetical protein [Phenylobacterium sp.]
MRMLKRHPYRRQRFNLLTRGGWMLVMVCGGLIAVVFVALRIWG